MQIQLKQAEIIEGLKQYIAKQGISLAGKEVVITFTAGRKETGLSADISIDDNDFPVLVDDQPKPALTVVKAVPMEAPVVAVTTTGEVEAGVSASTPAAVIAEAPAKSLFG